MADTKKFTDRNMRKGIKRAQRKSLKALHLELTPADRRSLKKEPQGIKQFLAEKAAAAAAAEAEAEG